MQTDETPSAESAPAVEEAAAAAVAMEAQTEVSPLKVQQYWSSFCRGCVDVTGFASSGGDGHSSSVESALRADDRRPRSHADGDGAVG